ncbi:MAG TPA: thiolase family protein [Candidatus Polarisedimenticolaceae bacterium]|nr:thiolase family protein [Candidatus Polarisedimenticolaceae bacterium]
MKLHFSLKPNYNNSVMSIRGKTAIVGVGETPTDRLGSKPGEPRKSSAEYLAWAMHLALEDAGLTLKDLDGQGLGVTIPTAYPQPFWPEEVAEILGITPGFLLGGATGGAGAVSLLGGMAAAINSGLIDVALCIGAAAPFSEHFGGGIQPGDMRDFEIPFGTMGPNSKIAMVMRRHMHQYGTTLDHLGKIAVAGRYHASLNPSAYLRKPITIKDYKESRLVADPVRLLDCVLPANGGKAYIMTSPERARNLRKPPIFVRGFGERSNPSYGPRAGSDALTMGVADAGRVAMEMASVKHGDISFLELYDDYIIVVYLQIEDLGFCAKGDLRFFERTDFTINGQLPIQTGGGMINCGQPSTAGGTIHVIEAVRQLRGEAGERQVADAKIGLVTGLGVLPYGKNLGCCAVAVLDREA